MIDSNKCYLNTEIKKKLKNCLMDITDETILMQRSFIETIFSSMKLLGILIHFRHRSPVSAFTYLFAGLTSYPSREDKPSLDQLLKLKPYIQLWLYLILFIISYHKLAFFNHWNRILVARATQLKVGFTV